jgi:hypothetical protein
MTDDKKRRFPELDKVVPQSIGDEREERMRFGEGSGTPEKYRKCHRCANWNPFPSNAQGACNVAPSVSGGIFPLWNDGRSCTKENALAVGKFEPNPLCCGEPMLKVSINREVHGRTRLYCPKCKKYKGDA